MTKIEKFGLIISLIIGILSFVLSLFVYVSDRSKEVEDKKRDYLVNGQCYRPLLTITASDTINVKLSMVNDTTKNIDLNDNNIKVKLKLLYKLNLFNSGNVTAKIVAIYSCQFPTGNDTLRTLCTNKSLYNTNISESPFYHNIDIMSQKNYELNLNYNVEVIKNQIFVQHILVVYQNEAGNYFDTYFWLRFRVAEEQCRVKIEQKGNNVLNILEYNKNGIQKISENQESNIFSKSQSEDYILRSQSGNY